MPCPICNGERWLCEEHELTPFPCACGGPYLPCRCNPAEDMPSGTREVCSIYDSPVHPEAAEVSHDGVPSGCTRSGTGQDSTRNPEGDGGSPALASDASEVWG